MHRGLKGGIITMVATITGGIISTIKNSLVATMVETIITCHIPILGIMGKVFKMEVLKVPSLAMEANKETLGMVIQTTKILYLLNVKYVLE